MKSEDDMSENSDCEKSSISKARSPEEIADYWDSHSLDNHWEQTHEVEFEVRTRRADSSALPGDPSGEIKR